jgi:hypothetical protein
MKFNTYINPTETRCAGCNSVIAAGKPSKLEAVNRKDIYHTACADAVLRELEETKQHEASENAPVNQGENKPQPTAPAPTVATQPIQTPGNTIPQPSPGTTIQYDPLTQTVITIIDSRVNDRIQAIEERLAKSQVITHEIVINIPSLNHTAKLPKNAHPDMPEIMSDMLSGKIIPYLLGPAGSGKTTMAQAIATALGLKFYFVTFCASSTKSELTGNIIANGEYLPTVVYEAVKHGKCVILFDEVDNTNGNLLTNLNSGFGNRKWAFPKEQVIQHETCYIIAAGNTDGRGNNPQFPEREALGVATIDRFVYYEIGYDEIAELDWALSNCENPAKHDDVKAWVKIVQKLRHEAIKKHLVIAITPRASIYGAVKIASGFYDDRNWTKLADRCIFKGIDESTRLMLLPFVS